MRGFDQNIRNGNSYALINSELRIPIVKYFYNRPLKSSFFENFQIAAFADAGTAWTGSDPYSNENSLYKRIIYNGPLKITVISVGEPMVSGVGFGFRTTLLGYFIKVDHAWGFVAGKNVDTVTYISLGLDF
jgi:outer membrane protein assembly factor BamA